ncbi:hypothetical protein EHQ68_08905 [Leptospira congkakensis]|uniref:DUF3426 domain-containing protein n=1 Tax=Leptospira congkakensis TaxID=2484932 RepID=A0A4Z1AAY0_9LEPT|nr:hypothetical protein [Leptospira congkakensis]TGL88746.1 hypothetical protein EHQ69_14975 [Leptospira congkakensis]TGL89332.1 hypothetical protein EHQ68_08905 [Leptospira congkakensis]TGL97301.1 hypothetical protein EHQ70_08400 [Leptospira congkakensis]
MSSKQCPSCGSTNIYQESATTYRCGDCFDRLPTGSTVELPPPKVYGTSKQNSPTTSFDKWKNIITGIVVAWLVLGSSAFTYFKNSFSPNVEEETAVIQIDPNLESIEIIPEGEFQFTSALPDIIGNVYIVGKFTNKSGQNLLMPKFTVDLLSPEGINLGSSFGYAEKNIVPKDESVSFQVLLEKAPSYDHFNISVTATTIPGDTKKAELLIKQIDFKRNQNKEVLLLGKIQNRGNVTANFTKIVCLLIDKQGQTIDYESISLEKEDFLPKESQNFQIIFSRAKQFPDSYYCETDSILKENSQNQ